MSLVNYCLITILALFIISCDEKIISVQEQAKKDQSDIIKFLKTNLLEGDKFKFTDDESKSLFKKAKKHNSGVFYVITNEGKGKDIKKDDKVLLHYELLFLSSIMIESSYDRGYPSKFKISNIIKGLQIALPFFKTAIKKDENYQDAGKGIILIPSNLAYGPTGNAIIPPNTPIIFRVKILDVIE